MSMLRSCLCRRWMQRPCCSSRRQTSLRSRAELAAAQAAKKTREQQCIASIFDRACARRAAMRASLLQLTPGFAGNSI